jgi:hypothetical protein
VDKQGLTNKLQPEDAVVQHISNAALLFVPHCSTKLLVSDQALPILHLTSQTNLHRAQICSKLQPKRQHCTAASSSNGCLWQLPIAFTKLHLHVHCSFATHAVLTLLALVFFCALRCLQQPVLASATDPAQH